MSIPPRDADDNEAQTEPNCEVHYHAEMRHERAPQIVAYAGPRRRYPIHRPMHRSDDRYPETRTDENAQQSQAELQRELNPYRL